ncbi:hypothetical protein Dimus_005954 [Dionaea muscipula]
MHTRFACSCFRVCAWNIASSFYPPTRSPASIRRKAIAVPSSKPKGLDLEMRRPVLKKFLATRSESLSAHKQEEQAVDLGVVVVKRATIKKGAQVAKIPNPRAAAAAENIKERKLQRKLRTEESVNVKHQQPT